MHTPGNDEIDSTGDDEKTDAEVHQTRRELALLMTGLVGVIALVAVFQDGAMPVLDKVLPFLTLAFGWFFGQQAAKL